LEAALDRLIALPYWPRDYDESHHAMAQLKGATSELIGRFCVAAEQETVEQFGRGPLRRYQAELVVPASVRAECALLKAITAQYVMLRPGAPENYAHQREIVAELTHLMLLGAPITLEPIFASSFVEAKSDAVRLRTVVDQVASLTDRSALALFGRLREGK
jgi:dGTPase